MADEHDIRARLRTFICADLMGRADYPLADGEPVITGGLIDSFSLAHLAVFIDLNFGVYIPDADLTVENFDTLDQLVARVVRG